MNSAFNMAEISTVIQDTPLVSTTATLSPLGLDFENLLAHFSETHVASLTSSDLDDSSPDDSDPDNNLPPLLPTTFVAPTPDFRSLSVRNKLKTADVNFF